MSREVTDAKDASISCNGDFKSNLLVNFLVLRLGANSFNLNNITLAHIDPEFFITLSSDSD